ncbi:hypothetical protein BCV70DRAFT_166948 [Testicularia cyperi]|uniref:histone deacetylase n=1 Tax=Testicularia cyperi TaxID=1882483 RepID=A0A317XHD2_9BASI|nr:hypothetical protein BCV70DRAFT_166948 [Testicularia cyperi]
MPSVAASSGANAQSTTAQLASAQRSAEAITSRYGGSPDTLRDITPAMSVTTSSTGYTPALMHNSIQDTNSDRLRTGYVYDAQMMLHVNPIDPEHPEKPVRIWKIFKILHENNLLDRMKRVRIREVTKDEVKLVHDEGIWKGVEQSAFLSPDLLREQGQLLDTYSSLYINEHSAYAARLSCGGAIELCDAIAAGRIRNGFAIVRPPGHHAEPHKSMGFCFYNNVAVATRFLQQKYHEGPNKIKKILILDWDVHHGNGTQKAFESDADVLYISLHRYDEDGSFYPGGTYGFYDSVGTGPGEGRSVNVPWPVKGMGDGDYLYAFHHLIMPIALEFAPDFVIISAGFDAAKGDQIGQNEVTPDGYAHMTHSLTSLCEGRVAVVLEGGYNPDAVAKSALAVTRVILSNPPETAPSMTVSTVAARTVQQVCRVHSKYWKNIVIPEIEADDVDVDPTSGTPSIKISELISEYRRHVLASSYDLMEIPLQEKSYRDFDGQVLCSEGILQDFSTIIFIVHDMGNLRYERITSSHSLEQESLRVVDASRKILEYARDNKYGLIDMNVLKQFSSSKSTTSRNFGLNHEATVSTAAFIWDNVIAMAQQRNKNVVLIGLGSGCSIVTALIQQRDPTALVRAVINIVGYSNMPRLDHTADLARKKWYWMKSKIILPADHQHVLEHEGSPPLKRYGRIQISNETRVVNMLNTHMPDVTGFIEKKLRKASSTANT